MADESTEDKFVEAVLGVLPEGTCPVRAVLVSEAKNVRVELGITELGALAVAAQRYDPPEGAVGELLDEARGFVPFELKEAEETEEPEEEEPIVETEKEKMGKLSDFY